MEGKGLSPFCFMNGKKLVIPFVLFLSLLRDLADCLVLFLFVFQCHTYLPETPTYMVVVHLMLGMVLAGLVGNPQPRKLDFYLAPFANFMLIGLVAFTGIMGSFIDPIFVGFGLGLGRVAFQPAINAMTPLLGYHGRYLIFALSKVLLFVAIALAVNHQNHPADLPVWQYLTLPIELQFFSMIATTIWLAIWKGPPPSKPSDFINRPAFEDDIIPRSLNAIFQGIALGCVISTAIGLPAFHSLKPEFSFAQIGLAMAIGFIISLIATHPTRCIGITPIFILVIGALLVVHDSRPSTTTIYTIIGFLVPLLLIAQRACRPEQPTPGKLCLLISSSGPKLIALTTILLIANGKITPKGLGMVLLVLSPILTWLLLRTFLEEWVALAASILYKPVAHGPGLEEIPARGPAILISNHCAYMDPFWIGKVAPRRIFPMMTSMFYDLPIVRWLMAKVVCAIRVEASAFRREAPELKEASAVLQKGGCLLLFPEGRLRRKEEQLLFPFGQGVWLLMKEFPEVPVFPIWIEGSWGSMMSYFNGPPFKNKKLDFRRPVELGIGSALKVPPEVLENQRACRAFLQNAVLSSRGILGLKDLDISLNSKPEEPEDGSPNGAI